MEDPAAKVLDQLAELEAQLNSLKAEKATFVTSDRLVPPELGGRVHERRGKPGEQTMRFVGTSQATAIWGYMHVRVVILEYSGS